MNETIQKRIDVLVKLAKHLHDNDDELDLVYAKAQVENPWFTMENCKTMIKNICASFLNQQKLSSWLEDYDLESNLVGEKVGLVLAGNIPAVGFHDVLTCYILGKHLLVKCSDKDSVLIHYFIQLIKQFDQAANITIVDRLKEYDKVIATGSNNTSIYFEQYFGHVPHIIRRNRVSVAIVNSPLTKDDVQLLGHDMLSYFGLGCRNVSHLFIKEGIDPLTILDGLDQHEHVIHHNKYKNNFDYSSALYLLNKHPFFTNGFLILRESEDLFSRISCVHFQKYSTESDLKEKLTKHMDSIQCIVSKHTIAGIESVPLGQAQQPSLLDYADRVDTVKFLLN